MPIYRGRITRITQAGISVRVQDLGGSGYEYGPFPPPTGIVLNVGDEVAVGSVGDVRDDLVLLAGLTGGNVVEQAWPVGSIYLRVDDTDPAEIFGFGTWVEIPGLISSCHAFQRTA